jgi:hypothetical protein
MVDLLAATSFETREELAGPNLSELTDSNSTFHFLFYYISAVGFNCSSGSNG